MTIALAILCLALVALLTYRERTISREREQAARKHEWLIESLAEERAIRQAKDKWAAEERKELYQRIQAPEVAVAEAHRERRGPYAPRKPVGADDDAAYQRKEVDGG
jgi:Tfp pilus assembly protein PilV